MKDCLAESEAAKAAAVAELRAYAQQVITAGGNTTAVNAALETAIHDIWKCPDTTGINFEKNRYIEILEDLLPFQIKAVDFGLPSGLKWASANVGAKSVTDIGLYYNMGGCVEGHDSRMFDGVNFVNCFEYDSQVEFPDGRVPIEYDAARANMGGKWRIPTVSDFSELKSNSIITNVENYKGSNINGILFTSKNNGNSIFFPVIPVGSYQYLNWTNGRDNGQKSNHGSDIYLWANDLYHGGGNYLILACQSFYFDLMGAFIGMPIRAVCE